MPIIPPEGEPRESGGRFINQLRTALDAAAPWDGTTPINQAETHLFFEPGAKIFRWGDRAYFGAAVQASPGTRDWSEALRGGTGGSFSGVVNVSGTAVTRVSGDSFITAASVFSTYSPWKGQSILLNGVRYTILSVTNGNTLTLTTSAGTSSGITYAVAQGMIQSGSGATVTILADPISAESANLFPLFTAAETQQFVPGGSGNGSGYGFCSVHVNNSPVEQTMGWAIYAESHRMNSAVGWSVCAELEIVNRGQTIRIDPINSFNINQTHCLQLGSGGGLTGGHSNTTGALIFFNNGSKFNSGLLICHDSIDAAAPGGTIAAIEMPGDYQIQWYTSAATVAGAVTVDNSNIMQLTATNGVQIPHSTTARYVELGLNLRSTSTATSNTTHKPSPYFQYTGYIWNGTASSEEFIFSQLLGVSGVNSGFYLEYGSSRVGDILTLRGDTGQVGIGGQVKFLGKQIDPIVNYDQNLGAIDKKFLSLHAAELWVETLVAQDTIATIGGRILVGPTTALTSDLLAAATSIVVKHNQMVSGDRVYMEANGKVEFMAITSGPSGVGPYTYSVTRNLDGSGANDWFAGDAVFNTGQTGNGFIDIYSLRGVKAGTEIGPAIVGNIRNSATFNDWSSGWAIGNLNGLYGYSATTYGVAFGKYIAGTPHITIDSTNGYRTFSGLSTVVQQIDNSGNVTLGEVAANQGNAYWNNTTKTLQFRGGAAGTVVQAYIDTTGAIVAGAGAVTIDANGISIALGVSAINLVKWSATEYIGATAGTLGLNSHGDATNDGKLTFHTTSENDGRGVNLDFFTSNSASDARLYNPGGTSFGLTIGANSAPAASAMLDVRGTVRVPVAPTATANFGNLSIGSGPFDGSTSGFFTGLAAGTQIAINTASGGTADFARWQLAGVTKFKVTSVGAIVLPSTTSAIVIGAAAPDANNYLFDGRRNGFAQLRLEGNSTSAGAADFLMFDTGAATNAKYVGIRNQAGVGGISSFVDDGSAYQKQNIIAWDNLTGSVMIGNAALATTATDGFLYIPTCAGAPTGTPTAKTGRVPMIYDTTNNHFYFYNSGWKKTTVFA